MCKALVLTLILFPCLEGAQQPSGTKTQQPEMESKGAPVKFTSRVNLVPVTVVVRDANGRGVGNLTKEDFRVFDNGKPQVITKFSIEKPGAPVVIQNNSPELEAQPTLAPPPSAAPVIADHFTAYLFDDLHARFEDLSRVRDAAARVLSAIDPAERVAIYTTSGQVSLEFTNEQGKIQDSLMRLRPVSASRGLGKGMECPDISYYMADLIVNRNDTQALQVALTQYQVCSGNPYATASGVMGFAQQALNAGEHETRLATSVLGRVIRRMSAMPGQRGIVMVSPGFLVPTFDLPELTDLINRAVRASVIIGTLDARGLWTPPAMDVSRPAPLGGPQVIAMVDQYLQMEAVAQEDVLAELADGTGGAWFHNSNDLAGGLQRLGVAPEYIYVLGFTPENLKSNGKFHTITVALKEGKGLTLQARKGYYAPRREAEAADQAKQDIEDALFSRDVMKDIPLVLHTQFFKSSQVDAKLSVVAQIDIRQLRYRLEDGRHRNDLTVVSALFDPNGTFVAGEEKKIEMRLRDETMERLGSGITIKSTFDVKTGSYVVRLVVRDSAGQTMATQNGSVEIP